MIYMYMYVHVLHRSFRCWRHTQCTRTCMYTQKGPVELPTHSIHDAPADRGGHDCLSSLPLLKLLLHYLQRCPHVPLVVHHTDVRALVLDLHHIHGAVVRLGHYWHVLYRGLSLDKEWAGPQDCCTCTTIGPALTTDVTNRREVICV